LMISNEIPNSYAIESVQFVLQNRTEGRTVANAKYPIGGHIPGGIEKNTIEAINIFVVNEFIGLESEVADKLIKGDFLEIAMQKVKYANGDTLDMSEGLLFVRGVETAPDEEHIWNERQKTKEGKMQEVFQQFLELGIPKP